MHARHLGRRGRGDRGAAAARRRGAWTAGQPAAPRADPRGLEGRAGRGLAMVSANLNELELHTGTVEGDPDVEAHFGFPMFWATGNTSTAVLCVELEPGRSGPRHIDMPEEILLVERGEVEIEIGDERATFGA